MFRTAKWCQSSVYEMCHYSLIYHGTESKIVHFNTKIPFYRIFIEKFVVVLPFYIVTTH